MKTPLSFYLVFHGVGNAWPLMEFRSTTPLDPQIDRPRGNTSVSLLIVRGGVIILHVLFDFGAGCFEGIRKAKLPPPNLILLTHLDVDHASNIELDSLARFAEIRQVETPEQGCTRATWESLPPFQRSKFEWAEIHAGGAHTYTQCDVELKTEVVDASSHRVGAVNYVVRFAGKSVGALFDIRYWPLNLSPFENLDVAIVEADSQYPLAPSTGHTSVADDVDALRRLKQRPRYTIFMHYGHQDADVLTQGSLTALIHGLAPDLPSCVAWQGMTISSECLPPRNGVSVLDAGSGLPVRACEKSMVHEQGMLHGSVIVVVRSGRGEVMLYRRHATQSYAGCLDVFGGHCAPEDGNDPWVTALREISEELRPSFGGFRVVVDRSWLTELGVLESHDAHNRERSNVFALSLPSGIEVKPMDAGDDGVEFEVQYYTHRYEDLLKLPSGSPGMLADGLARVLAAFGKDSRLFGFVEEGV